MQDLPRWFLGDGTGHDVEGPLTNAEILSRHRVDGRAGNLLWTEGMPDWAPIHEVIQTLIPPSRPEPIPAYGVSAQSTGLSALVDRRKIAWVVGPLLISVATILAAIRPSGPDLDELTAADASTLRAAARASFTDGEPRAAVAIAQKDLYTPSVYVSANLPDGQLVGVAIAGVPQTLLDRGQASAFTTVRLRHGFARTEAFRRTNGSPFVKGDYVVTVSTSGRTLTQRAFFLGGSKNRQYEIDLAKFHSLLRTQAAEELRELRQLAETLLHQTEDLHAQSVARRLPTPFPSPDWLGLQSELGAVFAGWSDETFAEEKFYGDFYREIRDQIRALSKAALIGPARAENDRRATMEPTISNARALVSRLARLAARSADVSGMPARERP